MLVGTKQTRSLIKSVLLMYLFLTFPRAGVAISSGIRCENEEEEEEEEEEKKFCSVCAYPVEPRSFIWK